MSRCTVLPALLLLALPLAPVTAQQAAAPAITVTTTAVSRVTMFRILPGQGAAHNQDIMDHLIPLYEEYKKAGIIVGYSFFGKATSDAPDDWNFATMLTFPNWAALDTFGARTNPITLTHYGTAERRTMVANGRASIRTTMSSSLVTSQAFSR